MTNYKEHLNFMFQDLEAILIKRLDNSYVFDVTLEYDNDRAKDMLIYFRKIANINYKKANNTTEDYYDSVSLQEDLKKEVWYKEWNSEHIENIFNKKKTINKKITHELIFNLLKYYTFEINKNLKIIYSNFDRVQIYPNMNYLYGFSESMIIENDTDYLILDVIYNIFNGYEKFQDIFTNSEFSTASLNITEDIFKELTYFSNILSEFNSNKSNKSLLDSNKDNLKKSFEKILELSLSIYYYHQFIPEYFNGELNLENSHLILKNGPKEIKSNVESFNLFIDNFLK